MNKINCGLRPGVGAGPKKSWARRRSRWRIGPQRRIRRGPTAAKKTYRQPGDLQFKSSAVWGPPGFFRPNGYPKRLDELLLQQMFGHPTTPAGHLSASTTEGDLLPNSAPG